MEQFNQVKVVDNKSINKKRKPKFVYKAKTIDYNTVLFKGKKYKIKDSSLDIRRNVGIIFIKNHRAKLMFNFKGGRIYENVYSLYRPGLQVMGYLIGDEFEIMSISYVLTTPIVKDKSTNKQLHKFVELKPIIHEPVYTN